MQAEETPTPHTVDVAAGMIASTMRHLPGKQHKGRAYDLVSPYRQLAVSDDSRWASYVALWNHQTCDVSVFALHALPFGASRSVFSFLRVIHSVWHLGAFFLWLIWSCYYDDLISLSDAEHTDFTHRTIDAFFTLLGWVYAKDGSKSQAYSEAFSALGVCFVLSDMHLGRVTICNTEKRIQQLLEAIRGFLAKGNMTVPEALKLRGQLQFACGQVLGRQFRIFLSTLTDYAYGDSPPVLPSTCTDALENFAWMLENSSPRAISVDGQRPMYLFTDACYNPHDDGKCGIGGMLFNHKGQLLAGFSHRLGKCERIPLGEGSSDTIIMAAEFVAVSCAISAWQDRLKNVPLVLFIDNNACRDVLISAKGRSPLMRKLLAHYLRLEHKVGYTPWVARVPSPSNCADAPSQVHTSTHGAHGQGRGDTRISCARGNGSGQRQNHNVQTHAVDGGAKEAADPGSAHCPFRLGSLEAHRGETETRKISPSAAQGAPGNDPGRRAVSAGSQRGEPSSATSGGIAAPHAELRQTIFTLGRVKQIESLPPGLSQKDLRRVDVRKGKPKFGPSRSGESKDAQSASGSRGDQPAITSWMVQPKPSGDGQNDRKRGASQSDVARQTPSLPSLTLHNPGNHCYLNSIVQALYWIYFAVPSDRNSVFGDLHPLLRPLLSAKGRVQLLRRSAWRGLLQGWANVNQQQDTAELLEYLRHSIHIPGLIGKWEARTMRGMQVHVHQHMTGAPLISIPGGRGLGLQRELELWAYEQDSGHVQALADPPVILSIQLLRFRVNQSGEVNKLSHSVPLVHRIYVPRFTLGIETDQTAYELHSAVYHLGSTPRSGHYKALGRMGEVVAPNDQNGPTGHQRGSGGADNTALYCIDDDAQAALVSLSDVHEIQCNWYLAFFLRSQ